MDRTFGERILLLREHSNFTQQYVADVMQLTRPAIGHWERGEREPDLTRLCKLADLYEVSIDWLLGRKTDEEENIVLGDKNLTLSKQTNKDVFYCTDFLEPRIFKNVLRDGHYICGDDNKGAIGITVVMDEAKIGVDENKGIIIKTGRSLMAEIENIEKQELHDYYKVTLKKETIKVIK